MSNLIYVEWLHDEYDCENCGPSYATGYKLEISDETGVVVMERVPIAHCYDGQDFDRQHLLEDIMDYFGYTYSERDSRD